MEKPELVMQICSPEEEKSLKCAEGQLIMNKEDKNNPNNAYQSFRFGAPKLPGSINNLNIPPQNTPKKLRVTKFVRVGFFRVIKLETQSDQLFQQIFLLPFAFSVRDALSLCVSKIVSNDNDCPKQS